MTLHSKHGQISLIFLDYFEIRRAVDVVYHNFSKAFDTCLITYNICIDEQRDGLKTGRTVRPRGLIPVL